MKRLRDYVPTAAIAPARQLVFSLKATALRCIAWSRETSSLYYAFASPAFRREQRSVAAGMLRHLAHQDPRAELYTLRRDTHRLEKALLMRPRRDVFALDYIEEAVTAYRHCVTTEPELGPELNWARDVLTEYFSVVGNHPTIERARRLFQSTGTRQAPPERVPYRRDLGPCPVDYAQLLALAMRRRSVRWFADRPVPRDLLDKAIRVAQQAPSSCNRQPYVYRFFDEKAQVSELSTLPLGTAGFAHNIPVLCAVVGDLSAYFDERDRHGIYIDASLSIMGFMFALETLGLSSCPLNWPDIERRERHAARRLGLAPHERIIMFIAIGYPDPDGLVAYSQKQPLDYVRTFS